MSSIQNSPRWRTLIESALAKYPNQTVIQISTISNDISSKPQPKVRSHIFRSFLQLESLPANLPLLISSTDIRSPKVSQIRSNSNIELVWWIEGTQQQFRITGKASLVPSPDYDEAKEYYDDFLKQITDSLGHFNTEAQHTPGKVQPGSTTTTSAHQALAAVVVAVGVSNSIQEFWETQRQACFHTMSAHLKASWACPAPGIPLSQAGGPEGAKKWPERIDEPAPDSPADSQERKNWEKALRNFALVVIEPFDVDFADLGVQPNKRFRFLRDEEGAWEEEELVP